MGRVKTGLPLRMSDVKTGYGVSTGVSLRSFAAGGSYANTYTATENGTWLNTSAGAIKLSDFVGATNLNVTFSGTNTLFTCLASTNGDQFASAGAAIYVYANGVIQLTGYGDTSVSYTPAATPPNSWLQRQYADASATVGGMYEVLWVKTSGNAGFASNNTWQRLNATRGQEVQASSSGSPETNVVKGRMKFRRYSDGTELANVYCELYAYAYATNFCPTCCFTPETLVLMASGDWMAIVDVQVGDEITTRSGSKRVTEVITRTNRVMYQIQFADGRILNASEDHPIYVVGRGYAAINPGVGGNYKDLGIPEQLYVGDFVLDADGKENEIVSIEEIDYPHTVYTFAESEFYANGMLVY